MFDGPLNSGVQADIGLVWGAEAENQANKGVRVVMKVDVRSILNTAAVEVEQLRLAFGDYHAAYKAAIGLLDEHVSVPGKRLMRDSQLRYNKGNLLCKLGHLYKMTPYIFRLRV